MAWLLLASGSPRRRELLEQLGYSFEVLSPDIEEVRQTGESPSDYVQRLSLQKAQAGFELAQDPLVTVIGSDTVVVAQGEVLEKPLDEAHFELMMQKLSGAQHSVMTAVSVVNGQQAQTIMVETKVWFRALSQQDITGYWQSGEPQDKAGGYGIQGIGGRFVARIEGSYHAVVGLPLMETDQLLQQFSQE
ncbi:nucleoside triphosphate pyrophosphatase [Vibrio sp. SCSIO 43136]|uniref:Maf family protein n=1 Tax=Vibrio sp. SCSIO 43136 TaxID=2819101 RepID=UPI002075C01C|nr:nucleoside triphosphate pyrophosphatase [Vibrio sp. SCSIO 43136]USD65008.1 septum formation inhibitor Maf [Vibrio sp. SCSIO 43136]